MRSHDAPILITGANRGIGLALVREGRHRGPLIATCRKASPELEALSDDVRIIADVDVTDPAKVAALAGAMDRPLGGLILNAGRMGRETLDDIDFEGAAAQFTVNALGPLRVARALLDHLAPNARVVIISSRMGSIGDNGSGGGYGYRMSKAAVNAAGKSLAVDLKPRGISVRLLHPGSVKTELTAGSGQIDPQASAAMLWTRIDEMSLEATGQFLHANGQALPW